MTRQREDYEQYLNRCREISACGRRSDRVLSVRDFERSLHRLDSLCLISLERELTTDEQNRLKELTQMLMLEWSVEANDAPEADDAIDALAAEGVLTDEFVDSYEDEADTTEETEVVMDRSADLLGADPLGARHSRLGSLRPDARNRRALWQKQRRGSRP